MKELLEELKHNREINVQKGLENKVDIDYIIERLEKVSIYYEVARNEVETAIDDIANDDYYSEEDKKEFDVLTDEDIDKIAKEIYYNEYAWENIYEYARDEVVREIGL